MRRPLAASALFAAGLAVMTAAAQPPAGTPVGNPGGGTAPPKPAEKKAPEKKAAEVEQLIDAALEGDPDVRLARAKIALAQAELAKARQAAAVRVTTLRATIQELRSAVAAGADRIASTEGMVKKGVMPEAQVQAEKDKLEAARAKLAGAEAELRLIAGGAGVVGGLGLGADTKEFTQAVIDALAAARLADKVQRVFPPPPDQNPSVVAELAALLGHGDRATARAALLALQRPPVPVPACTGCHDVARDGNILEKNWHGCPGIVQQVARPAAPAAPKGPVSDRLRAALDKTVSLGPKDAKVTWEQAVEVFKKDAGLDVPVRAEVKVGPVVSLGETLPVGAWLQLFADGTAGTRVLVREYGLLVTSQNLAPPDGVSVFEFWKQKPAAAPKAAEKPARGVSYRHNGRTGTLPYHATAHPKSDEAFRAAIGLVKAGKAIWAPPDAGAEWAKALDRDHMRFVIPDPQAFGLGGDEPVEIMVAMADLRNPAREVWTRVGVNRVQRYTDFGPDAAKTFADALQTDPGPKK